MTQILLIEDDTVLREVTAELLVLSKYQVIKASNGRGGIEKAKKNIPDIIVCDIMMPDIDGYTVLETLSKDTRTKYIPFIFISAKTDRKDVRKGMELGADDYLTKPFSEDELISAIESRLAKAAIVKDIIDNKSSAINNNNEDEIITINDLKNFFDDKGEIFSYAENDIIYNEGNNSNYIYLIRKGVVKCYKFDELGKELITALHKEDDFFGFTAFMQYIPSQETATAVKDVELLGISKSQFKNILENNHKVSVEIIQLLSDSLSGVNNQLLNMAYSSVIKKTASTILKFADKLNRKPEDPIKISRSDLASVAGIATETFIRTMSNFKKEGLIEIEGRNIRILDIEKLKRIH
jgi:CRP-like cAMP-binding protein/CheY-like chemotaxis protein